MRVSPGLARTVGAPVEHLEVSVQKSCNRLSIVPISPAASRRTGSCLTCYAAKLKENIKKERENTQTVSPRGFSCAAGLVHTFLPKVAVMLIENGELVVDDWQYYHRKGLYAAGGLLVSLGVFNRNHDLAKLLRFTPWGYAHEQSLR